MNTLAFDIETVPDTDFGRKLFALDDDTAAKDVADTMYSHNRARKGHDFLPCHWQKIVAIGVVVATSKEVKVLSLGDENTDEHDIVKLFFQGVSKYKPILVSWNGKGFDLPVIHYRALKYGISAPYYWEMGDNDPSFRWNNYLNRFHLRHTDLMDFIATYQNSAIAKLDEVAQLIGLPGKMGLDGSKVWQNYQAGDLKSIRDYCEIDTLNTYIVYLRLNLIRGILSTDEYQRQVDRLKDYLADSQAQHLLDFLTNW